MEVNYLLLIHCFLLFGLCLHLIHNTVVSCVLLINFRKVSLLNDFSLGSELMGEALGLVFNLLGLEVVLLFDLLQIFKMLSFDTLNLVS